MNWLSFELSFSNIFFDWIKFQQIYVLLVSIIYSTIEVDNKIATLAIVKPVVYVHFIKKVDKGHSLCQMFFFFPTGVYVNFLREENDTNNTKCL